MFDPSKLDPSKLDLSKLDPSKLDLSKLDPSKLDPSSLAPAVLPYLESIKEFLGQWQDSQNRFAKLQESNAKVSDLIGGVRGSLSSLSDPAQYQRLAAQFDTAVQLWAEYLQDADAYHEQLRRLAQVVAQYRK